jgi:hypothetical protein
MKGPVDDGEGALLDASEAGAKEVMAARLFG